MGELAAVQMAWTARIMTGQKIDPQTLNPYAVKAAPVTKSPEQMERENALAWKLLDRFFCGA